MIFARLLAAVALVLTAAVGRAPAADPPELKQLPWHLADIYLDLGTHKSIKSLSVTYQLFDDIPGGAHGVFLAPICGRLSGTLCYAGGVSQAFPIGTADDRSVISHPGHGFRQFGSKSPDRVLPAKDGHSHLDDYEGDFAEVITRGPLKKGVYTLRLAKREKSTVAFAKDTCVVDMTVRVAGGNEVIAVGALVLPQADFSLDGSVCCFCEIITGWDAKALSWRRRGENPPHGIPHFRYAVGDWRIDDEPVAPKSMSVLYCKSVPQRATVHLRDDSTDRKLLAALDKKLDSEDTLVIAVQAENVVRRGKDVELPEVEHSATWRSNKFVVEELKKAK
jgi:hypothetical protein